jgi:hypothetical protein
VGAYVLGGVGLAGLAVGAITGGLVFAKKGAIDRSCVGAACNREGMAAVSDTRALGLVSTVSFIAGGVVLVGGGVLFFSEPRPLPRTGAPARWVSVDMATSAGGALARVQGVW